MSDDRMPQLAPLKVRRKRSGKIVTLMLVLLLILLAVLFFRSDLSKIKRIDISGNRYTAEEAVKKAINLSAGDSFFADTAGRIKARLEKLPFVATATVDKQFPGLIRIHVREYPEVAYQLQSDGKMTTLLSIGLEAQMLAGEPVQYLPVLSGWRKEDNKQLKMLSKLLESIPGPLLADISEIKPDPSRSYPDRIHIYTRSRFEVITTIEKLADKLDYMRAIIGEHEPGVITMLEANSYRPYQPSDDPTSETPDSP